MKTKRVSAGWWIDCPCGRPHVLDARWTFNGDVFLPTFTPSLKVWIDTTILDGVKLCDRYVCHSFIEDGQVRFLDDCTHKFRNQTVDLPEIERDLR